MTLRPLIRQNHDNAVLFEDRQITYGELHSLAARVSSKLLGLGVSHETRVGLALDRSPELLPAILGIWGAGAAYVPLDPRYPRKRHEMILKDAGIEITITPEFFQDLPEPQLAAVEWQPESLAYIMYTSGSTGQPNGVAVTQGSVWNFVEAVRVEMDVTRLDTILAVGPVSFDISVMELFLPIFTGATLALAHPLRDVHREVERFKPTMMIATPVTWRLLLQSGWNGTSSFKAVSAGDVLPRSLANQLLTRSGKLWNGYGPTETTAGAAFARVTAGEGPVPIGTAIANVDLTIIEGELYIGGAGVARGYWNRPELTAKRFLQTDSGRLYRTGDLVRPLPDGQLEFIGRADDQLKVRGVRMEPGEIEAVLEQHSAVREAAVTATNDTLTAHVAGEVNETNLRDFLEAKLPRNLWPSRIVFLNELPLTANGKLDRRTLADKGCQQSRRYLPPRTGTEISVAQIFAEILQTDRIGINDNFFHLGGQSLLAAQVMARVWELWQTELPVSALFDSPTVAQLAARVETWQKTATVEMIERQPPGLPPQLSFSQERIHFLQDFHQSALYNLPLVVRLKGKVDPDRLEGAFNQIVRRHEVLRTTNIKLLTQQDLGRVFDLDRDDLIRASLVQRGADEYELSICIHHIAFDGWSATILFRELSILYGGGTLDPLPIQYNDFSVWQRSRLTVRALELQQDYWRTKLAGLKGLLELPSDRPRPPVQTYPGGYFTFHLTASTSKAVEQFSRANGVTVFMTLLTTFHVLLARYTGQHDICIGTAISGRTRKELENLIGLFINTLALRTTVPISASFLQAAGAIRATLLEAIAHQEIPFEKVVETLDPERSLSHSPFFQVMFTQLDHLPSGLDLPGIESGRVETQTQLSKFDLSLNLDQVAPAIRLTFEYNTDLFDPATIARMAGNFTTLLGAAMLEPDRTVATLPLLTPGEQEIFAAWNQTAISYPANVFLYALHRSESEALVFEGVSLTHKELNERSNRLAHRLRKLGARTDVLIGVRMERSIEMVVALLAILKAGAAYLPLDPGYPASRLDIIIKDAKPLLILTESDCDAPEESAADLDSEIKGSDLAYVIYTSGSTGQPKGVANTHEGIANRLFWMRDAYKIGPSDRVLQKTPFSFDVSVWEFFLPLIAGACLVIARPGGHQDPSYLIDLIRRERVTALHFVPSMLKVFLQAPALNDAASCASIKHVISSGEALSRELVQQFFMKLRARLHNLYGPTEAAVDVTSYECFPDDPRPHVPIGRPIANIRTYVLDASLEPVPIGVAGELHVAGIGLARGYLNNPDLTAEKFIEWQGERLYKTGDRARFLPDGNIEYLGRLDNQVKLRGFRIELGEIETKLEEHSAVISAAVAVENDQLIAWIEANPVTIPELRAWLRDHLPEYMVPDHIFFLDALPLGPTGKLDRHALPSVNDRTCEMKTALISPANDLERELVAIWESVLNRSPISVTQSFFELGGHSLQAARLVQLVEEHTGCRLPLSTLFSAPTVRQIAAHIRQQLPAPLIPGVAALQPFGRERPIFLVETRSIFWKLGQSIGPTQPLFGLEWPDPQTLTSQVTLEQIAERHVNIIRAQQPQGPYVVGGWCIAALVAWEIACRLTSMGERVEMVLLFDGTNAAPFLDASWPQRFYKTVVKWRASAAFHLRCLAQLPRNERLPYTRARLRTLQWVVKRWFEFFFRKQSESASKDISKILLDAAMRYRPRPYAGRVAYFRRGHVPETGFFEPDFGWGRLMDRKLEVYKTGGRHKEMFESPNVEPMAAIIRDLLAEH